MGMTVTCNPVRLPRFKRVKAAVSLEITSRDLRILQTVESFRLLSSEQIQALSEGSEQTILRRLQKLYHAGLLDRLSPRYTRGGGSQKMTYAITNRGIGALQKAGLIKEVTSTDRNASNRDLRKESIEHRLLISYIRAVFTLACQTSRTPDLISNPGNNHATFASVCQGNPDQIKSGATLAGFSFLFWREGRQLQDTIEVALPKRYARIPVAPDGFFALGDAQGRRAHFLVEADRGTMTLKRFTLKLRAYAAWRREKRHEAKLGIKNFRVLTVTSSAIRCRNLVEAAAAVEDVHRDGRLFLFAAEQDLSFSSPESVFTKIWTMPSAYEPQALFRESIARNPLPKENNPSAVAPL